MNIHDSDISKSIDLNIIGTCNIVKACKKNNIKLIYFSTGYVYEGKKGNYKESDPVKPLITMDCLNWVVNVRKNVPNYLFCELQ